MERHILHDIEAFVTWMVITTKQPAHPIDYTISPQLT